MKPHLKQFGLSHTRVYKAWRNMHERCENPKAKKYECYGGRGIAVCHEWAEFKPFYDWAMGNGYAETLTLERKDNDKGYSPANCTWITSAEQQKNKRNRFDPSISLCRSNITHPESTKQQANALMHHHSRSFSNLIVWLIEREYCNCFRQQTAPQKAA